MSDMRVGVADAGDASALSFGRPSMTRDHEPQDWAYAACLAAVIGAGIAWMAWAVMGR